MKDGSKANQRVGLYRGAEFRADGDVLMLMCSYKLPAMKSWNKTHVEFSKKMQRMTNIHTLCECLIYCPNAAKNILFFYFFIFLWGLQIESKTHS